MIWRLDAAIDGEERGLGSRIMAQFRYTEESPSQPAEVIDVDAWYRASISLGRRLYESKYGIWSIIFALILEMLITVNYKPRGDLSGNIFAAAGRILLEIVFAINSLFLAWCLYIVAAFVLVHFSILLELITGPVRPFYGIGWRARLLARPIPLFGVPVRRVWSGLQLYRSAIERRSFVSRLKSMRLLPAGLRLGGIAGLIYGVSLFSVNDPDDPSLALIGYLSVAAGIAAFASYWWARPIGRGNYSRDTMLKNKWAGYLAIATFFIAPVAFVVIVGALFGNVWKSQGIIPGLIGLGWIIAYGWFGTKLQDIGSSRLAVGRAMALPSAEAIRKIDPRRPILYLRAFADDYTFIKVQESTLATVVTSEDPAVSLETSFTGHLGNYGPVVAVGDPSTLPTEGAARAYPSNWQDTVIKWLSEAELIVLALGNSPGVQWEMKLIADQRLISKTIFIVPPGGGAEGGWRRLQGAMPEWQWQEALRLIQRPDIRIFYFRSDGAVVGLRSSFLTNLAYGLSIHFAIYGLKVHEASRSSTA
jgi:hypothetical protein